MKYKSGIYVNLKSYIMFMVTAIPSASFYLVESTTNSATLVDSKDLDSVDAPNLMYLGELWN